MKEKWTCLLLHGLSLKISSWTRKHSRFQVAQLEMTSNVCFRVCYLPVHKCRGFVPIATISHKITQNKKKEGGRNSLGTFGLSKRDPSFCSVILLRAIPTGFQTGKVVIAGRLNLQALRLDSIINKYHNRFVYLESLVFNNSFWPGQTSLAAVRSRQQTS